MKAATKTQATKPANKSSRNTPVAKVAGKPAKVTKESGKANPKVEHANPPKALFALVAGTVAMLTAKGLKQAVAYHVAKGNLAKVEAGVKLTEQGALLWNKDRVNADPAKFQEIAAFVHGGALPAEWKGQPVMQVGDGLQFSNMLYWGSFSSQVMRQAFAALFSKKA